MVWHGLLVKEVMFQSIRRDQHCRLEGIGTLQFSNNGSVWMDGQGVGIAYERWIGVAYEGKDRHSM